jgi:hypothetical protein
MRSNVEMAPEIAYHRAMEYFAARPNPAGAEMFRPSGRINSERRHDPAKRRTAQRWGSKSRAPHGLPQRPFAD